MRYLAAAAFLSLGCLASCSGPPARGVDARSEASHESIVRSYTDAVLEGMARARAERLREAASLRGAS
jgi:hypothetical protein